MQEEHQAQEFIFWGFFFSSSAYHCHIWITEGQAQEVWVRFPGSRFAQQRRCGGLITGLWSPLLPPAPQPSLPLPEAAVLCRPVPTAKPPRNLISFTGAFLVLSACTVRACLPVCASVRVRVRVCVCAHLELLFLWLFFSLPLVGGLHSFRAPITWWGLKLVGLDGCSCVHVQLWQH